MQISTWEKHQLSCKITGFLQGKRDAVASVHRSSDSIVQEAMLEGNEHGMVVPETEVTGSLTRTVQRRRPSQLPAHPRAVNFTVSSLYTFVCTSKYDHYYCGGCGDKK